MLELDQIRIDGGTQSRVELNQETVAEYAQAFTAGATFPPVVAFFDGAEYWLADGFHRYFGARDAGESAMYAEIKNGTKLDAQLFSFSVNADHGLRRSNADKRKAVTGALNHPVSCKWSDNQIAKHCGVDHKTVAAVRSAILGNSQDAKPVERTVTRNGTTYTQDTSNIGKAAAKSWDGVDRTPLPTKPATAAEPAQVEPEAEAPPEYTELDAARDQITELQSELVVARMGDIPEDQKTQAAERIAALQAEVNTLTATLKAVQLSRDSLMEEAVQMKRQMKAQREEIARLKATK